MSRGRRDRGRPGAQRGGGDRRRDRRDQGLRPVVRRRRRRRRLRRRDLGGRSPCMARPSSRLPYNLGIGGAVQTGFKYALDQGYELAVRLDGDGQHVPRSSASCSTCSRAARRISSPGHASPSRRRLPAAARAEDRDRLVREARLPADAPTGHGHDVGVPGAQPEGHRRCSRGTTRATTRRWRRRCSSTSTGCGCSRCPCRCASGSTGRRRSRSSARSTTC